MAKNTVKYFYLKLAFHNLWRSRLTYFPYLMATAIISGVYLLIGGLMFSDSLNNLPAGETAALIFAFGLIVFSFFAFFFMVYINNFLIAQRKKEFALYAILGLEKRHVRRVLLWENLMILSAGVLLGMVVALVFGRLLFLILLKLIHAAVAGSSFSLSPTAFLITGLLFAGIFVITSIGNLRKLRLSNPMELLRSSSRGEKESKLLWPVAILGVLCLGAAYYFAWTIVSPSVALGVFFLLALLVILGNYALFTSGSIVFLKLLRANKKFYYKLNNFVTISGLIQRMKQNARGLASICILSTMLIVSVSGTLALYLGREEMNQGMYPFDISVFMPDGASQETVEQFEGVILDLAEANHVSLSADEAKLVTQLRPGEEFKRNNFVYPDSEFIDLGTLIYFDGSYRFDAEGTEADCLAFTKALRTQYFAQFPDHPNLIVGDVFTARVEGYGLYGGLLFLGVFFGILFLAVTVLIIYFKQITEGYEDRERFQILQKVGMDDKQVKTTINRQVLMVFFVPLITTVVHMVFASHIMARMLMTFMLYDWGLVLRCIGGVLALFALMYLAVYLLTAKVYYRIVKR